MLDVERIEGWKWVRIAWHHLGLTADPDGANVEAYGDELYVPDRLRVTRRLGDGVQETADLRIEEGGRFGMTRHLIESDGDGLIPLGWVRDLGFEHHARLAIMKEASVSSGHEPPEGEPPEDRPGNASASFFWGMSGERKYLPLSGSDPRARTARNALRSQVGRPPVDDDELRAAARVYVRADRAPIKAVQAELGLTYRTAARRIEKARERGILDEVARQEKGTDDGER